jgi:periplasmic protein TonB
MKTPLFLFAMGLSVTIAAQPPYRREIINYLDQDGNRIEKAKTAAMLQQIAQLDDTTWEINYYRMYGPRLMSARARSSDGRLLNGDYVNYSANGWADTAGYYYKGKREGIWTLFAGLHRKSVLFYRGDSLIWQKDTTEFKRYRDSIRAANHLGSDSLDVESVYPGGGAGWLKYLQKHLRYPDDALKKNIKGQVVVGFAIDDAGELMPVSFWLQQSVSYSCDMEAMRVIAQSGRWDPAEKGGKKVRSYKKQPVVFRF